MCLLLYTRTLSHKPNAHYTCWNCWLVLVVWFWSIWWTNIAIKFTCKKNQSTSMVFLVNLLDQRHNHSKHNICGWPTTPLKIKVPLDAIKTISDQAEWFHKELLTSDHCFTIFFVVEKAYNYREKWFSLRNLKWCFYGIVMKNDCGIVIFKSKRELLVA